LEGGSEQVDQASKRVVSVAGLRAVPPGDDSQGSVLIKTRAKRRHDSRALPRRERLALIRAKVQRRPRGDLVDVLPARPGAGGVRKPYFRFTQGDMLIDSN